MKCKKPRYLFSKGLCAYCYKKQYKPPKIPKRQRIKAISEKKKKENLEYQKIRTEWMKDHDVCQANLPGCLVPYPVVDKSQLECHHMKGRGVYLTDKRFFLCVCNSCHRWITDNSRQAIEMGLSLPRIE